MDDALVSALVKDVLGRLTSAAIGEFALLRSFKGDILALKEDFERNEALLEDAESQRSRINDVDLWLKSLKSACLEVENVVDEISSEALLQRLHKNMGLKYRVRAFFSSDHNQCLSRVRMARKVKAIRKKLDIINSKGSQLSLTRSTIGSVDVDIAREMPPRETSSFIHDSSLIIGREKEMEMVTKIICKKDMGKHENGEIPVYAIWGMGGIGKTTLAQLVYNNESVSKYFDLKCWVYVFENFQVKEIIKGIITSIDKCECTLTPLDVLQETLQSKLRGNKFLIVLDDVWIEEGEKDKWEELSKTLSCGVEGSIVVMTTRSNTTCHIMAKVGELQHELGCLSKEDSWLLFKKLAFAEGREGDGISELEPLGREIVDKCKGLPLAVKTLGSLMWSKSRISDWQHVKDNNIWGLPESNVLLLPALKLSYDNLLPHLKRCFAYCCLFPKGYFMEKDVVIQLWLSNGFVPPKGETDLHVLGEEIFDYIVWRSFFLKVKDIFSGNIYQMHDLMYDMARHVMRHDCVVYERSDKELIIPDKVLHLSSSCPDFLFSPQDLEKLRSLRSILMLGKINELHISKVFNHVYLRVLSLPYISLRTLPKSICKLRHLRYLNLSYSSIEVLPKSIIYLQNLQYLNLSESKIKVFPEWIIYLQKLQHLNLSKLEIEVLPASIINLKKLKYLNLSKSKIKLFPESIIYLKNLQHLNLFYSEIEVLPESIICLKNLQYLNLSESKIKVLPESIIYLQKLQMLLLDGNKQLLKLPEGLRYMRNLQHLGIQFCPLTNLPSGIKELTNLRINLSNFPVGKENGAKIGELGNLNLLGEWLQISNLENVGGLSEAKSGNLKSKTTLSALSLSWSRGDKYDEEVLEGLEPNPCLENLTIEGYLGKNISPSWMVNLSNLVEIQFLECHECEHIPALGRLPNLRVIDLCSMGSLKCFHDDDTTNVFLCLKELHIYRCMNLLSLPSNLPKLEDLDIIICGALVSLPGNLPSIRELHLKECDRILSLPDEILKDLNKLEVEECLYLSKRYEKEIGEDWPKVSHIPDLYI